MWHRFILARTLSFSSTASLKSNLHDDRSSSEICHFGGVANDAICTFSCALSKELNQERCHNQTSIIHPPRKSKQKRQEVNFAIAGYLGQEVQSPPTP